jgi:putative endonuclease
MPHLKGCTAEIQPIMKAGNKNSPSEWHVYIILCSDASLYTGITTDIERRFAEHANLGGAQKGAKYFRGRSPKEVIYSEGGHTRSTASQREAALKKLSREQKLLLVETAS